MWLVGLNSLQQHLFFENLHLILIIATSIAKLRRFRALILMAFMKLNTRSTTAFEMVGSEH